ncbi:MAG TPA: sodium-dependent transporter, partial [Sutterella sp.]|nr:sodium-dependent transporter [Sutterella sp.]
MQREHLSSRLGFLMLSAGCAIGVGNVWKFPWLTGQNGGGIFVLVYLCFLVLLGLPVMTMEFSVGRAAQKSPVCMYQELEPTGSKWHWHGYAALVGNVILMMFYSVVSGWMLYYLVSSVTGTLAALETKAIGGFFGELLASAPTVTFYTVITVIGAFIILSFPLRSGLETVSKWMMGLLFALMVFLALHSLTLNGASEGLSFYLLPDFSKFTSATVVAAMNQAFFSLSIGIGSMAIFASYINKEQSLVKESASVIALDTLVAILGGLIIFPACFTYGVKPTAGPSLIFEALPTIFHEMPLGRLWGSFFFLFMTFATFSTVLAVCEAILSCVRDLTQWSRPKAS